MRALMRFLVLLGLLIASGGPVHAAEPADGGWSLSKDGAYAIDRRAGLVWLRCAEGMPWDGRTCTGLPQLATHGQAMAMAAARRQADGGAWRLPRARELQKLVARRDDGVGVDPALFPATLADFHWASNANLGPGAVNPYNYGNIVSGRTNDNASVPAFLRGWAVNLGNGEARGDLPKSTRLPVRLVREITPRD